MTKMHLNEGKHYACNHAVGADYRHMTLNKSKVTCKNCRKKIRKNPLTESIAMMGITAGVGAMMLGGIGKMFGLNDDKGNLKEMMSGMVQGFLEHYEYKLDTLREDLKEKKQECERLKQDKESLQERYDEVIEMLEKKKK